LPNVNRQAIILTQLARLYGHVSQPRAIKICGEAFESAASTDPTIATSLQSQVVDTLTDLDVNQAVSYLSRIELDQVLPERDQLGSLNPKSTVALRVAVKLLPKDTEHALELARDQLKEPLLPAAAFALFAHNLNRQNPQEGTAFYQHIFEIFERQPISLRKAYDLAHILPSVLRSNKSKFLAVHAQFLRDIEELEQTKPHDVLVDIENIDGVRLSRSPRLFVGSLMISQLKRDLVDQWLKLEPKLNQLQSESSSRIRPNKTTAEVVRAAIGITEPIRGSDRESVVLEAAISTFDHLNKVSDRVSLLTFSEVAETLFDTIRPNKMRLFRLSRKLNNR
jgi:hypothetical protein